MEKISISLPSEQVRRLEELVGTECENRSEAARKTLKKGFEYDELESRTEDLRRQLQQANSYDRDVDELVAYVEEERKLQRRREEREHRREQRRHANVFRRMWWKLTGTPDDETEA